MLKALPVEPRARLTYVNAHGWLPLNTTLPPVKGHCVRFAASVVALMLAQG